MKAVLPLLYFGLLFTSIDDINATGHNNRSDIVARYKGLAQKPARNHHAGNGHKGAEDGNRLRTQLLVGTRKLLPNR